MRKYETVFISDPDLQDQRRTDLFEKVRNIIAKENGILLDFDEWGSKKLAYEIRKKLRGYYVCMTFGGNGDLVKELERNFRLNDDIMKYMTVLISDNETAESLQKEAAEAQEAKAAQAEAAEKTAAPEAEAPEAAAKAEEKTGAEEPGEAKTETTEAKQE